MPCGVIAGEADMSRFLPATFSGPPRVSWLGKPVRQKPITFQRAVNLDVAFGDPAHTCEGSAWAEDRLVREQNGVVADRHSYERPPLGHCRQATKLRPRCLTRVTQR